MQTLEPNELSANEPKEQIPPLPYTYVRTEDPNQAQFTEVRVIPSDVGKKKELKTDTQVIESVKSKKESKEWYFYEYWRKKGVPKEQLELQVGEKQITIYNFSQEKPFTEEHIDRAQRVFEELASRFPQLVDQIRWVLIDDIAHASAFGDPEKYPFNGDAMREWHAFRLLPRGMKLTPHRVQATSNFEGTFAHELTHLIDSDFEHEWGGKFKWAYCIDYPDDWERKPPPDGLDQRFFNKQTGEMYPQGQFPLQPDQCITYYAKLSMEEDICESMVAYIYDPELLKKVSPDKFDILSKHDVKQPKPQVSIKRIPREEIRLPEVKPETVYYYIKEPTNS